MTGLIIRSVHKRTAKILTLIECEVPQDRKEIPALEIVRAYPHHRCMAGEISPLDESAKIQLLICKNAPEGLKVRTLRNGPKGAPWAKSWHWDGQYQVRRV